jgi:hypothetical protein
MFGFIYRKRYQKRGGAAYISKRDDDITMRDPSWKSAQEWQMNKSHADDLQQIIDGMNSGRIGREAGHHAVFRHFSDNHFSMAIKDKRGKTQPVESQYQSWLRESPAGQRAHEALNHAPEDTMEEREKALRGLTPHVEHASNAETSIDRSRNPAVRKLEEIAKRAQRQVSAAGHEMTWQQCFSHLCDTPFGQRLLQMDRLVRLGD